MNDFGLWHLYVSQNAMKQIAKRCGELSVDELDPSSTAAWEIFNEVQERVLKNCTLKITRKPPIPSQRRLEKGLNKIAARDTSTALLNPCDSVRKPNSLRHKH